LAKQSEFVASIRSFCRFFLYIRCTSPIGGVRITEPIVLAQHKGNERIVEAQTPIRCASPIVEKLPINFAVLTGHGNIFNMKRRQIKNLK
jgi:hypothetical protein